MTRERNQSAKTKEKLHPELRQEATALKKQLGINYTQALDIIAKRLGCTTWNQFLVKSKSKINQH